MLLNFCSDNVNLFQTLLQMFKKNENAMLPCHTYLREDLKFDFWAISSFLIFSEYSYFDLQELFLENWLFWRSTLLESPTCPVQDNLQ